MQREEALARGEDKGSVESPADKSAVKEKAKRDKAERDLVKGQERVSAKLEKEKERERVKREKEMKVQEEVRARQEEVQKQKDFANELGRVQDLHKESEREREVEREKARVERERTIAERERAREEKMAEAKKTKEKEKEKEKGVKAPPTSAAPAPPVVTSASIFGGAKVTLRGGKSSTDLLATLSEPVVPPLPAPIVPPPTSSWSSLLTPPPPTAPNPTVSAPAPPPPPPPAPAPTPAWSASSSSSSYPNPYLGSAASAAAGAGRMGNAGGMGMGMGNGMGGMSNMGMGMGMGMGNSMGMGNGMGGMGNMGMGMGMGMMNMGMGMPMGMGGMGMDMGMGMSGMGNSMGMGGMSQPVPDSISDFPPLGDSAPEGKAEARRRQSGPTAPPTPSSGSRSGSRSNSVSGPSEPYRYVPSSAWADHQRAQLEAAAEGISTEKAPAPPATGTRSSSSASGTGVGSNGSASPSIESGSSSSSVNGLIEGASAAKVAGADEDRDINLLLSSSLGSLDTPYGQGGIPGMDELGRDLRTANSFGIGFGLGDGGMGNMGSIGGIGGLDLGSLDLGLGLGGSGQIGYPVDSFSSLIGGGVGLGQDMFTRGGSGSGSGSRAVGGVGGGGGGLSGGDDLMGILGGGFSNYMEPDPLRPQESRMGYGGSGSSFSTFDGMGMGMGMGNVGISSNLGLGLGIGGREGSSLLSGFSFPHAPDISISPPGALGGISRPSSASPFSSPPEQFRTPPPPPPPLPLPLPPHPPALALRGRSTQSTPARPLYSLLGQAKPSRGLDVHQLPETDFRSVAWLRAYGMHMYRWGGSGAEEAGQGQEWTEFAMHVPVSAAPALFSEDGAPLPVLGEIRARSGCALWDDWEDLGSVQSRFLVFRRTGVAGAGADRCLLAALDLVGSVVQRFLAAQAHALQGGQAQAPPSSKAPPGPPGLTDSFLDKVVSHSGPTPAPPIVPAPSSASNRDRRDSSDSRDVSVDMSYLPSDAPSTHVRKDRPAPLKSFPLSGPAYVQRNLEIPRDVVGLVIGQGGKKIKELCGESGAKIQFRVNKSAEREGRPGLLEVTGSADNADKALQLIWDVLQLLGREYSEVPISQNSKGK
ncbi:hypothetical protein B484DRAFT_447392 [Ochromonadaceae sp. CCMP2298]|nr:hypothetical protein B484DRAFT_447392 [Ochromonadaceae sp. CCMP2298]